MAQTAGSGLQYIMSVGELKGPEKSCKLWENVNYGNVVYLWIYVVTGIVRRKCSSDVNASGRNYEFSMLHK
jgi:hypothetical protein